MVDERDKIRAMRGISDSAASKTPTAPATNDPYFGATRGDVTVNGVTYKDAINIGTAKPPAATEIGMVSPISGLTITGTERNAAKEREAIKIGYTKEYIASRGGINAQGYFNDTPLSGQLSAAEYRSVTKPDGTIDTPSMARILQTKQIEELVSQGVPRDEATRRISSQYGQFGIGGATGGGATPLTATGGPAGTPSAGGGLVTQADVQKAVTDALATQQAKYDALTKQAAAEKDAAIIATRTKAKDKLTAMLASYNLQGLASYIDAEIMKDTSEEMILLGLYDQPAYKTRFPGMEPLRKAGRTISEDEYTRIENAMMQTARFFDLPKGFYDGPEDFGNLIGKQVSAKEYQDRLQVGQDLARSLNPEVKQQLLDFYAVGEGDLTAYVLDADKALSLIQKQAKAATFVGLGRAAGFNMPGISAASAENIVATEPYAKLTEAQMKTKIEQAGLLRKEQQRLSQIEGMTYNEQEALDAVLEGSTEALLASQQRAQREVSRFRSRGGVTGSSLASQVSI